MRRATGRWARRAAGAAAVLAVFPLVAAAVGGGAAQAAIEPGTPPFSATVQVTPSSSLAYTLSSITVAIAVTGQTATPIPEGSSEVDFEVLLNGKSLGLIPGNSEAPEGTLPVPAFGAPGGPACPASTVEVLEDFSGDGTDTGDFVLDSQPLDVRCASAGVLPADLTPAQLPEQFDVTANDFPDSGGTFTVTVGSQTPKVTSSASGAQADLAFTLDAPLPCGASTVTISQSFSASQPPPEVKSARSPPDGPRVRLTADTTGVATATGDFTVFCPEASVSPAAVTPGQLPATFTVTPSDFPPPRPPGTGGPPPADPFTLTLDGSPVTFTTVSGGGLAFSASPGCGTHTLSLSRKFNDNQADDLNQVATATTQLTVFCPALPILPNAVTQADLPAAFGAVPEDFPPSGSPFTMTVDASPVAFTTGDGSLDFTASPGCGAHTVTVARPFGESLTARASGQLTVFCPAITVSPGVLTSAQLPATFTVDPGGTFPPSGQPFTVTVDGAPVAASAQADGTLQFTAAPECGMHTVTLSRTFADGTAEGENQTATASATFGAYCPAIAISPGVIGNQQLPATFAVTPSSTFPNEFPPSRAPFTMALDGTPVTFTTGDGGALTLTASPGCGTHAVTLSRPFDDGGGGTPAASATAALTVLCPQITVSPPAIPLASEPRPVQVTGSQFHPGQIVKITLGRDTVTAVTDEDGRFTVPVTATGLDCATFAVMAAEQRTAGGAAFLFSAAAPLQVTHCKLTLASRQVVLTPGENTRVTGTGFAPSLPVVLTWQVPGGGQQLLGTLVVTAGTDGSFSALFLVRPHDRQGPREVVATQGTDVQLNARALVVPAPAQPNSRDQLVFRD